MAIDHVRPQIFSKTSFFIIVTSFVDACFKAKFITMSFYVCFLRPEPTFASFTPSKSTIIQVSLAPLFDSVKSAIQFVVVIIKSEVGNDIINS